MRKLDLFNQRFGSLTVVGEAESIRHGKTTHAAWRCICDCGNETVVETQRLRTGHTESCGCLRGEAWVVGRRFGALTLTENLGGRKWLMLCDCGNTRTAHATNIPKMSHCGCKPRQHRADEHGMTGSREYFAWHNAKNRCFNEKSEKYESYGGRGITMCDEWRNSFEVFYRDMGECPPDYQLERNNNDGNYEPGNCRWASRIEQARNQRRTLMFEGAPLKEIAAARGMNYYTLRAAFKRGENPLTYSPRGA